MTTPAEAAATIARFCSSLHDPRLSGPVMISILPILMSLAMMQPPQVARVRTPRPNCGSGARLSSPEGCLTHRGTGIRLPKTA